MSDRAFQQCINPDCAASYALDESLFACPRCRALLDVRYDWSRCEVPSSLEFFSARAGSICGPSAARVDASGVWRFRELLPFAPVEDLVTIGEGRTILQQADDLASHVGHHRGALFLQYEGFNPSGSFKDNGMAAAFTMARLLNRTKVACASTGNTSASLAMFAGATRTRRGEPIEAIVFVGGGKIALGKLAQALDYGAKTIQLDGDFDECMKIIQESADKLGLYVCNSINPFRIEGQKTIMYRVLEGLNWVVPDWIVVPGGNLGNSSAFGKAFAELKELGLVDRIPRLAIINAAGANALYELYHQRGVRYSKGCIDHAAIVAFYDQWTRAGRKAQTIASAIEIGRPVNLTKALRSLETMDGVVRQVSDPEILDAKALVGRFGYGCEPASAASLAGVRLLLKEKVIAPSDRIVCILTGHVLKDPEATMAYHMKSATITSGTTTTDAATQDQSAPTYANRPLRAPADIDAIAALLDR